MAPTGARQTADDFGDEDLVGGCPPAKPARHHDRRTEPIAGLLCGLARIDADTNMRPAAPRSRSCRALLNPHGATDSLGRAEERKHHRVTDRLYDLPVMRCGRIGDQPEVRSAGYIRSLVTDPREVRRGVDKVGKAERPNPAIWHETRLRPKGQVGLLEGVGDGVLAEQEVEDGDALLSGCLNASGEPKRRS